MNRGLLALTALTLALLLAPAPARGTEDTPEPAGTATPVPVTVATATPAPPPSPAPQATDTPQTTDAPAVAAQLRIDGTALCEGMDRTYEQGYVPRVADGRVSVVLPLVGDTYDGRVTVTADLGATEDSPFVFGNYAQTALEADGRYLFTLEIPLSPSRYNGSYPVALRADYLDALGGQAQQTFTVYVTIDDGRNPPDPNAQPGRQTQSRPELFLSACTVEPAAVAGGGTFTVTATVENIGGIRARTVRLCYGSETAGILPVETNAALHLDDLASGASAQVSFRLRASEQTLSGERTFFITLDYSDLYGGAYTATRTFPVRVEQPAEMRCDAATLPREVAAGETVTLPANVFNTGRSTLYNVTVSLSGAGLFPTGSVFLGDIAPGEAAYGQMEVFVGMLSMTDGYSESYGKTSAVYAVSYEDEAGETFTSTQELSTTILEPVVEDALTPQQQQAEQERREAEGQWWVSVLVAFAIIAIAVAIIVVGRFSRMMQLR